MIFTKGAHQSAKFQENFNCLGEFHQIFTLFGTFCWKYIQFHLKKVQRNYASWYWRLMKNLNKNQFVVAKLKRIWWILIQTLKSLLNLHFHWSFCAKYIVFDLKKSTEELSFMTLKSHVKFEEKLPCSLKNDMRILANFHQNIEKSKKIAL